MFDNFWSALITLGFALLVGTIADLLFKKADFKWYWNLLFGVIGLFILGPLIVSILNAMGVTLPLSLFGLPVAWVDLAWELIFGIIGTFLLLTVLNALSAIFRKKDSDDRVNRVSSNRPGVDPVTRRDPDLDTDSRNRITTDDDLRLNTRQDVQSDTLTGNDFLEIRDNRDPDDRV